MLIGVGMALVVSSIVLLRQAKSYEIAENRFWTRAARSQWLPLLFTALFGFGVVAAFGGLVKLLSGE